MWPGRSATSFPGVLILGFFLPCWGHLIEDLLLSTVRGPEAVEGLHFRSPFNWSDSWLKFEALLSLNIRKKNEVLSQMDWISLAYAISR